MINNTHVNKYFATHFNGIKYTWNKDVRTEVKCDLWIRPKYSGLSWLVYLVFSEMYPMGQQQSKSLDNTKMEIPPSTDKGSADGLTFMTE